MKMLTDRLTFFSDDGEERTMSKYYLELELCSGEADEAKPEQDEKETLKPYEGVNAGRFGQRGHCLIESFEEK